MQKSKKNLNFDPKVSIIIVNWNGAKQLRTCLPALKKNSYANYEVILVDNASIDESVSYAKKIFPNIQIIYNKKNEGFAEGCNVGVKKATGKYVLLLNNDVEVTPDFLTILVGQMEKNDSLAGIQPKIIFRNSKKLQAGCSYLTNTGFLYHYGYAKDTNDKKYNTPLYVFSANGSCLLIRKKIIDEVGLFDPSFFAYFEETDFCWRAWLHGYKFLYFPKAFVYHEGAQTSKLLSSTFVYYHSYKNRITSLIKNLSLLNLLFILPAHVILCEIFAILSVILQRRLVFFIAINKAFGWNIMKIQKILQERKYVQTQIRKCRDREVFQYIIENPDLAYYRNLIGDLGRYKDQNLIHTKKKYQKV